jgi:hypothetical protein
MSQKTADPDSEDETNAQCATERSAVAHDLANLKSTITRLVEDRERLPQPMFWSLFNARINDIKKQKELERVINLSLTGES